MAYAGYLMRIGDFDITGAKYIQFSSYEVTRKVQDLDPYRDANGVLHRNTLSNVPITVRFDLMPGLTNTELGTFLGSIQRNYINESERKVLASVYVPELDDYVSQDMYMAEPVIKIRRIDKDNTINYEAVEIKFIGY